MLLLVRRVPQVVMVQDRIENQPIGPDGFSPVDGVVAEQQHIALAKMRIHHYGVLRDLGALVQ